MNDGLYSKHDCNIDFLSEYGKKINNLKLEDISHSDNLDMNMIRNCLKRQGYQQVINKKNEKIWIYGEDPKYIENRYSHKIFDLQSEKRQLEINFKQEISDLKRKHNLIFDDSRDSLEGCESNLTECGEKLELANDFIFNMIDCLLENYNTESLMTLMECLDGGLVYNNPYLDDLSRLVNRKNLEEKAYQFLFNLVSRNKWHEIDNYQIIRRRNKDKCLIETIIKLGLVKL